MLKKVRPEFDFSASVDFARDGLLDSVDVITLVSDFDKEFGISIDGIDIVPENFQNIGTLTKLLQKYGVKL
jgi:acyl carrier protein